MPTGLAVLSDLIKQITEVTVLSIYGNATTQTVEEKGHISIISKPVLYYLLLPKQCNIPCCIDYAIHEEGIAGEVCFRFGVALLKGDEVPKQRIGVAVDQKVWDQHHPISELHLQEALGLFPCLEFHSGTMELGRPGD